MATTLSARKISQRTGTSRKTSRKWLDGQALSRSKQAQLDDFAEANGILIASRLLVALRADQHAEARGLLDRFCDHFNAAGVLHSINGAPYLQTDDATLNNQFRSLIKI